MTATCMRAADARFFLWYVNGRTGAPSGFCGAECTEAASLANWAGVHTRVCTRMQGGYAAQMLHGGLTLALPASAGRCIRAYVGSWTFPPIEGALLLRAVCFR